MGSLYDKLGLTPPGIEDPRPKTQWMGDVLFPVGTSKLVEVEPQPLVGPSEYRRKVEFETKSVQVGPVSISLKGALSYEIAPMVDATKPALNIKQGVDPKQKAMYVEVEKEFSKVSIFTPVLKGSGEMTPDKVKIGLSGQLKTKFGDLELTPLDISFDIVKWEAGKPPEVMVGNIRFSIKPTMLKFPAQTTGGLTLKVKGEGGVKIKPDYAQIAKTVARLTAELLSAEAALASGLIGGGLVLIVYGVIDWVSDEVAKFSDEWGVACMGYARCWGQALRNEPFSPPSAAKGWAMDKAKEGHTLGSKLFAYQCKKRGIPPDVLVAEYRRANPSAEAWQAKWPQMKADCLRTWKEAHPWETYLTGGDGWGGDFKLLKQVLDAFDAGPYARG